MNAEEEEKPFVWINTNLLDDPKIRALSCKEFGRLFLAAIDGEVNVFSQYMASGLEGETPTTGEC
jgi:hypothetical protein